MGGGESEGLRGRSEGLRERERRGEGEAKGWGWRGGRGGRAKGVADFGQPNSGQCIFGQTHSWPAHLANPFLCCCALLCVLCLLLCVVVVGWCLLLVWTPHPSGALPFATDPPFRAPTFGHRPSAWPYQNRPKSAKVGLAKAGRGQSRSGLAKVAHNLPWAGKNQLLR